MTIEDRVNNLRDHMATQLRAKGETFREVAESAGRRIPRKYRKDVAQISETEDTLANPKLAHRLDEKAIARSECRLRWFLDQQDPKSERIGEVLDRIAMIAFILVVVGLAVFFYLISTGYFE